MLSPRELLIGSIVSYQGQPHLVKGVAQYIMLEGHKEWIGGSQMEGEPITEGWLENFQFDYDPTSFIWQKGPILFHLNDGKFQLGPKGRIYNYVHELQMLYWAITGEHLKIPKLK